MSPQHFALVPKHSCTAPPHLISVSFQRTSGSPNTGTLHSSTAWPQKNLGAATKPESEFSRMEVPMTDNLCRLKDLRKNEFQNCEKTERSGNRCLLGADREHPSVLILSVRRLSGLSRSLDPAAVRQATHCHSLSHYSCKHMHVQNEKTCSQCGTLR